MVRAPVPADLAREITASYEAMSKEANNPNLDVAVRSSATAEDLPNASFAGQQESFLNVRGAPSVIDAVRAPLPVCSPRGRSIIAPTWASTHTRIALSVGVQSMVRSDLASAGVIFTLDPDTGHRGVILVTSSLGSARAWFRGVSCRTSSSFTRIDFARGRSRPRAAEARHEGGPPLYDEVGHRAGQERARSRRDRARFSLEDEDVLTLARVGREDRGSLLGACGTRHGRWTSSGRRTVEVASSSLCRRAPRRCTARAAARSSHVQGRPPGANHRLGPGHRRRGRLGARSRPPGPGRE